MTTIFRTWSYQYPWVYALVSRLATLNVGGEARFHQLPLENLLITPGQKILDLCCGGGQATRSLVQTGAKVVGLDASPNALDRAKIAVPEASYVQGLAENLPFTDGEFDLVHTSVALHEMTPDQLQQIFAGVRRVLKPGGIFTFVDLHRPYNWLFWPPLATFIWLFETETAWQLINANLADLLTEAGFTVINQSLYAGGSLQVLQARKNIQQGPGY
jgi:demethylmenaquinone methyltransferase/2-methoxy-6-polyprenyl-1,4-benzoquinol methylase